MKIKRRIALLQLRAVAVLGRVDRPVDATGRGGFGDRVAVSGVYLLRPPIAVHRSLGGVWLLALLLGFLLWSSPVSALPPADSSTVVLVVRHAEKQADGTDDPSLTAAGRVRAQALVRVAGAADVTAIYTSHYARTRETAAPLAEHTGAAVTVRPATAATIRSYASDLAASIVQEHEGETVLVVTHSNLVAPIVEALGGTVHAPVGEKEYDRFTVVVVPVRGSAKTITAHYGPTGAAR